MYFKERFSEKITTRTDFIPCTQVSFIEREQTNLEISLNLSITDDGFPEIAVLMSW